MSEWQPATLDLFLDKTPLIDTRAPVEFAKGAFKHAVNLPILNDAERAAVGTCYKTEGQEAAIALGHRLVSGDVKEARVAAWLDFIAKHPKAVLYCFRGGMRSQLAQRWLREAEVDRPRVMGGYKALRRLLIDQLEEGIQRTDWWVLSGMTGSGKTHLLNQVTGRIDLEGLTNHRGSSFGRLPSGQPTQIQFENTLSVALLHKVKAGHQRLLVEDESRMIGRRCLPQSLYRAMQVAPVVLVQSSVAERSEQIRQDYVHDTSQIFLDTYGAEDGPARYSEYLLAALDRLQKRLGDEGWRRLRGSMESALDDQFKSGDTETHLAWISELLERYYDPIYSKHAEKKQDRIVFRGSPEAVTEYLAERFAAP